MCATNAVHAGNRKALCPRLPPPEVQVVKNSKPTERNGALNHLYIIDSRVETGDMNQWYFPTVHINRGIKELPQEIKLIRFLFRNIRDFFSITLHC